MNDPLLSDRARRRLRWTQGRVAVSAAAAAVLMASTVMPAYAALEPFPNPNVPSNPPGSYTEQVLASNGDNAIDPVLGKYYRIVALADLGDGVLLASYDGRPDGGDSPSANSIVQRRSIDGGKTWGSPTFIARGQMGSASVQKYGFSDPSYVVDKVTGTVFNFHVYSKNQGFGGSVLGNDDTDANVISSQVSVSTDRGLTWSTDPANQPSLPVPSSYPAGSAYSAFAGPLITNAIKPNGNTVNGVPNVGGVVSMFASSGEGIQLNYGAHAGRLIQQFAGTIVQPDGSRQIQAYSVYSDDHGKSWKMGTPTGTGMDENKTVELSDGRVMLNSRDSSGANPHFRKVAYSLDGGVTYSTPVAESQLPDPRNNGSITRMYPDAPAGSADAKKLLFSNSPTPTAGGARVDGTIRYSADDGKTWGSSRIFKPGSMSYSTLSPLSDGTFGVLYEGDNNTITFGKFDRAWLNPIAAALVPGSATVANGGTAQLSVTVTNNDSSPLPAATVGLDALQDWTSTTADLAALDPGASATVQLSVTAPSYAKAGAVPLTARLNAGGSSMIAPVSVTVTGGSAGNVVGAYIFGARNDAGRDLASHPYAAGSAVPYKFRVYSTGNVTESVVPQSGNFQPFLPPGSGNCRFSALGVWGNFLCGTPQHTVTADEVAQGFFVPSSVWQVTGTGAATQNYTVTGDEVDLLVRNPQLGGSVVSSFNDVDGDAFAGPGDTVTFGYTVTNTGNVALTNLSAPAIGLYRSALAAGESVSFTSSYILTDADIAAKQIPAATIPVTAGNGSKAASLQLVREAVALKVKPAKPTSDPVLASQELLGKNPTLDLGLGTDKYRTGQTVTVHNVEYGQWYYVYLNKRSYRLGWFFPTRQNTLSFVLPDDVKNGLDSLVVLDAEGRQVSFGDFQVTPFGSK
ncbi:exo-alpha-sialidase [Arthrobacter sp. MA-N2]|uniref:exo-alpha-sialidase n=1 Tax=Arthrobacter sp. MA-N2 TaxID=1101188 RepID=UPI0009DCF600|nr:exo-alpha-sialidase [Arthrobacter sp. MA-N2]